MTTGKTTRRKLLLTAGTVLAMVWVAWLVWGFNWDSSDEGKYKRLQGLERTCDRLNSLEQWVPSRISTFIHLHQFKYREMTKYELLRIELVTSGYLTNVSFEVTNLAITNRQRILADFSKVLESGICAFGISFQEVRASRTGSHELVNVTCRPKELDLWEQIISGDSNAPAQPIQAFPALFEGDLPGGIKR